MNSAQGAQQQASSTTTTVANGSSRIVNGYSGGLGGNYVGSLGPSASASTAGGAAAGGSTTTKTTSTTTSATTAQQSGSSVAASNAASSTQGGYQDIGGIGMIGSAGGLGLGGFAGYPGFDGYRSLGGYPSLGGYANFDGPIVGSGFRPVGGSSSTSSVSSSAVGASATSSGSASGIGNNGASVTSSAGGGSASASSASAGGSMYGFGSSYNLGGTYRPWFGFGPYTGALGSELPIPFPIPALGYPGIFNPLGSISHDNLNSNVGASVATNEALLANTYANTANQNAHLMNMQALYAGGVSGPRALQTEVANTNAQQANVMANLAQSNALVEQTANAFTQASRLGGQAALASAAAGIAGDVAHPSLVGNAAIAPVAMTNAGRYVLGADAAKNAALDYAIAGADVARNTANNARTAALAGNAYRNAKLAGARDKANVEGTIQNSASIADATIATHDTATRAEDALTGSEAAIDSVGTILDSDGAFIPSITSSLVRSLPYGRLTIRDILPRPLTWPARYLPDVWQNGQPVSYRDVPLNAQPSIYSAANRFLPASAIAATAAGGSSASLIGQPYYMNNGIFIGGPESGTVWDPTLTNTNAMVQATTGATPFSFADKLLTQAQVSAANTAIDQTQIGSNLGSTYQGYGSLNGLPLLTGNVVADSLASTTSAGLTHPIGSAFVIEPRDSFFQDY